MKQGYVVTAWVKLGIQKYAEVDIVIRITLHYKADFMIKTVKTFHYDCEGYDGGGRCKSVTVFSYVLLVLFLTESCKAHKTLDLSDEECHHQICTHHRTVHQTQSAASASWTSEHWSSLQTLVIVMLGLLERVSVLEPHEVVSCVSL